MQKITIFVDITLFHNGCTHSIWEHTDRYKPPKVAICDIYQADQQD